MGVRVPRCEICDPAPAVDIRHQRFDKKPLETSSSRPWILEIPSSTSLSGLVSVLGWPDPPVVCRPTGTAPLWVTPASRVQKLSRPPRSPSTSVCSFTLLHWSST
ncbi:jg6531 [Pararge aegeria aegeria]|uniref:Jg6531 protein n=1 Tax=Pararge aegeria aegeria TaxID=348720 RepID=A0A8S4S1I4_9NEOP|nr:jg6531 [Pararge aegeria aegeria]